MAAGQRRIGPIYPATKTAPEKVAGSLLRIRICMWAVNAQENRNSGTQAAFRARTAGIAESGRVYRSNRVVGTAEVYSRTV